MRHTLFLILLLLLTAGQVGGQELATDEEGLTLEVFLERSLKHPDFHNILIDKLKAEASYDYARKIPSLVLNTGLGYAVDLDGDNDGAVLSLGLTGLSPGSGTSAGMTYNSGLTAIGRTSSFNFAVSQSLLKNTLGRISRLDNKVSKLEKERLEYLVIESYEEYINELTSVFYNWYISIEKLRQTESVLLENLKLLNNIKERKRLGVADSGDQNKLELQVNERRESLIRTGLDKKKWHNRAMEMIGETDGKTFYPVFKPSEDKDLSSLDKESETLFSESRTGRILTLLKDKGILKEAISRQGLLPALDFELAFGVSGTDYGMDNSSRELNTGVSFEWQLPLKKELAQLKLAQYEQKTAELDLTAAAGTFSRTLEDLKEEIKAIDNLINLGRTKNNLAESIIRSEGNKYRQGRASINDLISANNQAYSIRLDNLVLEANREILISKYRSIADVLVTRLPVYTAPIR